jgi:hypothetical protein
MGLLNLESFIFFSVVVNTGSRRREKGGGPATARVVNNHFTNYPVAQILALRDSPCGLASW